MTGNRRLSLVLLSLSAVAFGAGVEVRLLASGERSFRIATGPYTLRYDLDADKDGWIVIEREGHDGAIGTKLAHGEHLNVTAARTGEGEGYGWKDDRKDWRIFRALTCQETDDAVEVGIVSEKQWARFHSRLTAYKAQPGLIHWTVAATAKAAKAFSGNSSPPDAWFVNPKAVADWDRPADHEVIRYAFQRGPASGIVYFQDRPMESLVFYFEDLTSLNDLYRLTGSAVPYDYTVPGNPGAVKMGEASHGFQMSTADGNNPQPPMPFAPKVELVRKFGFERPAGFRVDPGASLVFSDTYLYLRPVTEAGNVAVCRSYVEMLAGVYGHIRKPDPVRTDYRQDVVPRLLADIMRPENTSVHDGRYFLPKAYVRYEHDDKQLWTVLQLLHPLELYTRAYPEHRDAKVLRDRLDDCLPLFWDRDLHWFGNNLAPAVPDMFFHSVYIFIPGGMMADLALLGNENARAMFLDARSRYLALGKAREYVFADVWLRDFSKVSGYYQFDETGMYVYLMMAYHRLSGGQDAEALAAAKAAADRLADRCLDLGWQVNLTASGAVGCEMLHQATGDSRYRELAFIPLANALQQAWLWECDYGMGEKVRTFWSFCGCPAAPSSAEFESHRTRLLFRQYLDLRRNDLPPAIARMLADGWQYGLTQSRSALPPLAIADGAGPYLADEGRMQTNAGEIRHDQMIPLEDARCGWGTDLEWWHNNAKAGVVGQEIYGAGGPIWYALWQDELAAPAAAPK